MDPTVTIVLDGEFGDRLSQLPVGQPVWVADSPTNVDAAHKIRRQTPSWSVTTFRYDPGVSGPEAFAAIAATVELHHGPLSQQPPYHRLEVYGARPNSVVQRALAEIGFAVQTTTSEGFVAVATRPDSERGAA